MRHIEESDIEAYAAGHAGLLLSVRCRLHLRRCPECAARLEKARKGWLVVDDLKKALKSADECAPSQTDEETAVTSIGQALSPRSRSSEDGGR